MTIHKYITVVYLPVIFHPHSSLHLFQPNYATWWHWARKSSSTEVVTWNVDLLKCSYIIIEWVTKYSQLYATPSPTWLQSRLPSCWYHCCCSKVGNSSFSHECDVLCEETFVLVIDEDLVEKLLLVLRNESGLWCHIDCLGRTLLPQKFWTDREALPGNILPQCMSAWIAVVYLLGCSVGFQQSLVV